MEPCELGESSRTILEAIAEGRSYEKKKVTATKSGMDRKDAALHFV